MDAYPLLPAYLALRLANANSSRAIRLSHQREKNRAKAVTISSFTGFTEGHKQVRLHKEGAADHDLPLIDQESIDVRSILKAMKRRKLMLPRNETSRRRSTSYEKRTLSFNKSTGEVIEKSIATSEKQYHRFSTGNTRTSWTRQPKRYVRRSRSHSQSGFWSGGSHDGAPRPPKSVRSDSSSMNSSLHGSSEFRLQGQYQHVNKFVPKSNKAKTDYSAPGLPPPPVPLDRGRKTRKDIGKLTFQCDICGEKVKVSRRRQWQ